MNELIPTIQNRDMPEDWNYDESVKLMKVKIYKLKTLTREVYHELWTAHKKLAKEGRPKTVAFATVKTWSDYCEDIGVNRSTAHRWLEGYDPISKTINKEKKLDDQIITLDGRPIIEYKENENIYLLSGIYKDGKINTYMINEGDNIPTITSGTMLFHTDGREYTLREYAQVQEFPNTYKFIGKMGQVKTQRVNAVAPKMAEHIGNKLKGKTFGDLFAGAGGLSCGFEQTSKKAIWAVERNLHAIKTYQLNHPNTKVVTGDIKKINPKDLEYVDIIIGGPPCQGFSIMKLGQRFIDDPRNIYYKEFLRFVEVLRPKEFLMENVPQIQEIEEQIILDFNNINYSVDTKLVNGLDIGMKQQRKRYFFIGQLNDTDF